MTAKKILELIESVDPSDVAALDEIDARVWIYLNQKDAGVMRFLNGTETQNIEYVKRLIRHGCAYTRSRDALKAIRPEGWVPYDCGYRFLTEWWVFELMSEDTENQYRGRAKTEELAELHAIIQAIEYERQNKLETTQPPRWAERGSMKDPILKYKLFTSSEDFEAWQENSNIIICNINPMVSGIDVPVHAEATEINGTTKIF